MLGAATGKPLENATARWAKSTEKLRPSAAQALCSKLEHWQASPRGPLHARSARRSGMGTCARDARQSGRLDCRHGGEHTSDSERCGVRVPRRRVLSRYSNLEGLRLRSSSQLQLRRSPAMIASVRNATVSSVIVTVATRSAHNRAADHWQPFKRLTPGRSPSPILLVS